VSQNHPPGIRAHEDVDLFREAVNYTAAETGFTARLIEKDYFCTLLLRHTASVGNAVFKGGTCLAKVHADFYRLSEDMDFAVSVPADAKRAVRRKLAEPLRRVIEALPAPFRVTAPMKGHNNSTQYNGTVTYPSLLDGHEEPIFLELSLREPLLMPAAQVDARTLLRDPIAGGPMVPAMAVACIARMEAFAEKFRAALSRRDVAIRDFFDLDHAVQKLQLPPSGTTLVEMVRQKLAIPGNDPVSVGPKRLMQLRCQLDSRLRPVLRAEDFAAFDLDRAFDLVVTMAKAVGRSG
jgi:predicted nucleotidyltransferase component of viral defense system